jgi:glutamate synthase (NADPH/NADH) small chain
MNLDYENIKLQKDDKVRETLQSRHILDEEIKMVISNAETTGEKLYQPDTGKFLAKLKIGDVTFYVEYSAFEENTYVIHTAYSHRAVLEE